MRILSSQRVENSDTIAEEVAGSESPEAEDVEAEEDEEEHAGTKEQGRQISATSM